MKKSLVSVLIVTFNAEQYIYNTIKSCLKQTYSPIEILILDNGSTDNTVKIIKKFKKNKNFHIYTTNKNKGPYGGLNYLLKQAKGQYIAILDHDDLWLPEKIETQINFLESHPKEIACGTQTYIYYEYKNILILDRKPLKVHYVNHISLMFKNKGFRYNLKYLFSDEHFEKIILKGKTSKIYCIPKALAIHRIRKDRNNFSRKRYKLNIKFLQEYFYINTFNIQNIINLIGYIVFRYFPPHLEWIIIKIIKRNSQKITLYEFQKKHPGII